MFYNRKAIQRRIILEKFKDEDIDASLYSGKFGDDVEAAENDYYDNYSIYWPDDSKQPKWSREQADNMDEKGEGGYGQGGKYGAAKRIQAQMVEKYGEKWKEVAEQEIKTYYTKRKEKIEAELAKEADDEAYMKQKYPEKHAAHTNAQWGTEDWLGDNKDLEEELAECEEYIKNARHYILTQVGLRAINAIERGVRRNKWGKARSQHERKEHENFVKRRAAWFVWSPFLKEFATTGINVRKVLANIRKAKTPEQILSLLPQELHGINFTQLRQLLAQWYNYFKSYGYGLIKGKDAKQQIIDFVDFVELMDYPLFAIGRYTRGENGMYQDNEYVKNLKEKLAAKFKEAMDKAEVQWKKSHPDGDMGVVYNPFQGIAEISSRLPNTRRF